MEIEYSWDLAAHYAKIITLEDTLSITDMPLTCTDTYYKAMWYCSYVVVSDSHIHIKFNDLSFSGPNYLGDLPEEHDCTLSGVSVSDGMRAGFISESPGIISSNLNNIGLPKGFVLDSILPEMTTCYKVPLDDGHLPGRQDHGLPLKEFVTTSKSLILVIYAYGAYINLTQSHVELTITKTPCIGVTIGCFFIPGDGYIEIGSNAIFSLDTKASMREQICPFGHMLLVGVNSLTADLTSLKVIYCTKPHLDSTEVSIMSYMSAGHESACIHVQQVLRTPYIECRHCTLRAFENRPNVPLVYTLYTYIIKSVHCLDSFNDFRKRSLNSTHYVPISFQNEQETFEGSFLELIILFTNRCIQLGLEVSLHCYKAEAITQDTLTKTDIQIRLSKHKQDETFTCYRSSVSLRNEGNSHLIYVKSPDSLTVLDTVVSGDKNLGALSTLILDRDISYIEMKVNISINTRCPSQCKQSDLYVAYRDVRFKTVVLYWKLHIHVPWMVITCSQMLFPRTNWLIFITSFANQSVCEDVICNTQIETSNEALPYQMPHNLNPLHGSDSSPVAKITFLWTSSSYSWNEAETLCLELGMHLISITSKEEFNLVKSMLAGDIYDKNNLLQPRLLLTPCRVQGIICNVHLGLQVKVCLL